jgi:hypothetical protein
MEERVNFQNLMVAVMFSFSICPARAQQDVTYGRWAENPGSCGDPQHSGQLDFQGFRLNKFVCVTKGTETFYGGERRAMICDIGEHKGLTSALTFMRTSETTLQVDMKILDTIPIDGGTTLFRCPDR